MLLKTIAVAAVLVAVVIAASAALQLRRGCRRLHRGASSDSSPWPWWPTCASVGAKALTWQASLQAVDKVEGEERVDASLTDIVPAIFIGFLMNTILFARLGEVARVSVLRRKLAARGKHLSLSAAVGTLVTEQILSGITLIAGAGRRGRLRARCPARRSTCSRCSRRWCSRSRSRRRSSRSGRGSGAGARRPTTPATTWSAGGTCWASASRATFQSMRQGQAIFRQPRLLAWGLVTSTLSWIAQLLGIYWTLKAYSLPVGVGAAGVVFLASNLVQLFPITPGNLGVFQAATATLLARLYPEVTPQAAVTFSIGLQLIEALLGVGVGFVFLSLEGLSIGALRTEVEEEEREERDIRKLAVSLLAVALLVAGMLRAAGSSSSPARQHRHRHRPPSPGTRSRPSPAPSSSSATSRVR